ncbi:hypothetical protein CDCA_CDCA01G0391 [Cyanidium caldarium]|uniref:Cytidyltransferase-like domain-containing protein n=1 Tax=Cyanidium caldarium TaxID=2771 RepID=A0AAV9IQ98_CYACA|nr:hypothetical protein CDCA_CDCA01G0391 [Cyanidium caldarium]
MEDRLANQPAADLLSTGTTATPPAPQTFHGDLQHCLAYIDSAVAGDLLPPTLLLRVALPSRRCSWRTVLQTLHELYAAVAVAAAGYIADEPTRAVRIITWPVWIVVQVFVSGARSPPWPRYDTVAVGGTFDHFHAGHRLLLSVARYACRRRLRIGVTGASLLQHKAAAAAMEPLSVRMRAAEQFVRQLEEAAQPGTRSDVNDDDDDEFGRVQILLSELRDAAGPAGTDPDIDALVVSTETVRSARRVNAQRRARGLRALTLLVVPLVASGIDRHAECTAGKLSSTWLREQALKRVRP